MLKSIIWDGGDGMKGKVLFDKSYVAFTPIQSNYCPFIKEACDPHCVFRIPVNITFDGGDNNTYHFCSLNKVHKDFMDKFPKHYVNLTSEYSDDND